MTIETESIDLLKDALITLQESFAGLPAFDSKADLDAIAPVLQQVARRMRDNYPYPHPFYAGQ
ncbi:MAG: aspartate aminotransferase family protein, partial [Gammaproteobacteria bacterium]|nr:aspartate aminotransferase family protein [Gammaproteobacteria bacterium]